MIPAPFEYHAPSTIDDAVKLLATHGDEARVLAGGHSLIPMLKLRLATYEHLVDLRAVGGLADVARDGDDLVVGAMCTQKAVIDSDLLAEHCPILREAAEQIADPQVRYCGTLGGNVANGDPGNDMPAVMVALDARYAVQGPNGTREIPAREFYEAIFTTALAADEILTAVRIPVPAKGHGAAYVKLKRKIGDYATAAAAVILTMSGGKCAGAAVALTNAGETPLLVPAAADALAGSACDAAAIDAAAAAAESAARPASDARGPSDFRKKAAGEMVRRAAALARDCAA